MGSAKGEKLYRLSLGTIHVGEAEAGAPDKEGKVGTNPTSGKGGYDFFE